jgi:hypothetical protein
MNIDNCEKWLKNKNINPLTKRKIQTKRATYNKIEKECNKIIKINKKPKIDENTAAKKITNLFKPLLYKYSGNIENRINYYKIIHKYIKDYKKQSKNNCFKNYNNDDTNEKLFRIGKKIIVNKILGEGVYGIVFNGYFRPDIKNKQYGKALKIAIKISNYTNRNYREVEVFKKLSSLVIKNKCPHFPISYGVLECNKSILSDNNSSSSLSIHNKEHKNLEILLENEYFINIVELADGVLYDIMKNINTKTINILYNCAIQCLISIVFFNKYLNLCHDDAHYNNFIYYKIKVGGYYHYNIYGINYYLKNVGYLMMINDFGLVEDLTPKNLLTDITIFIENLDNIKFNNIKKNIIKETNPQSIYDYLFNKKKIEEPMNITQKRVYSKLFQLLSEKFPEQLLTTKPNDIIINNIPYMIL